MKISKSKDGTVLNDSFWYHPFCLKGLVVVFTEEKLKYYKSLSIYKRSKELVELLFKDKKDKSGCPYLHHLEKVSEDFEDERIKAMALMHDTLEDTNLTKEDLENLGYDSSFINVIELLTNTYKTYDEYIDKLLSSNNIEAIKIKLKDVLHNMDISRFVSPRPKDYERIRNKYVKSYLKIIDKLEGEMKK